jgi:hypothetical protein
VRRPEKLKKGNVHTFCSWVCLGILLELLPPIGGLLIVNHVLNEKTSTTFDVFDAFRGQLSQVGVIDLRDVLERWWP